VESPFRRKRRASPKRNACTKDCRFAVQADSRDRSLLWIADDVALESGN